MLNDSQERLRRFIKISEGIIPVDGLEAVQHYYDHGEYEMSYEGLVIELINANKHPDDFIFSEWKELALGFELDNESVFDGDFWGKFVKWGESQRE